MGGERSGVVDRIVRQLVENDALDRAVIEATERLSDADKDELIKRLDRLNPPVLATSPAS